MSIAHHHSEPFHPYAIAFVGFSGSGKTTLIERILPLFTKTLSIGYLKHDAHKVVLDHEGKDTWRASKAGASRVLVSSDSLNALISDSMSTLEMRSAMLGVDWLIMEGFKNFPVPKVALLDEAGEMLAQIRANSISHIRALVCLDQHVIFALKKEFPEMSFFVRDDIAGIAKWLLAEMESRIPPIHGLVLAGGKSQRMGMDKATISYHEVPQAEWASGQMEALCDQVFYSRRVEQEALGILPTLSDQFLEMGPLGGILSAMRAHRNKAWLVVACDMPYLTHGELARLVEKRNPYRFATALKDPAKDFAEPLAAIYEPKCFAQLLLGYGLGISCPRKILNALAIATIAPEQESSLSNANTVSDLQEIVQNLHQRSV